MPDVVGASRVRDGARVQSAAAGASGLVVMAALAFWGGSVDADPGQLAIGIGVVLTMLVLLTGAAWWLFVSDLPDATCSAEPQQTTAGARAAADRGRAQVLPQVVATATGLCGLMLVSGAAWDASWHRRYGVGVVLNDFFWPPHLVIYGSMAVLGLFALTAFLVALRGQGDLRRRVRRAPLVVLIGLVAAYCGASGPSDLVWHRIYGLDITAWSLPHLILASLTSLVVLLGAAVMIDGRTAAQWRVMPRAREEWWALGLLVVAALPMLLVLTGDYDGRSMPGGKAVGVYARPEWWYAVLMVLIGVLFAFLVATALRRTGAASIAALGVIALQALGNSAFGAWGEPFAVTLLSPVLLLPPAVAVDMWLWLSERWRLSSRSRVALGGLVGAGASLAVLLPLLRAVVEYPTVSTSTVPPMVVGGLLAGVWAAWAGSMLGGFVGRLNRGPAVRLTPGVTRGAGLAIVAVAGILVTAVVVSHPPVTACTKAGALCIIPD